MLRAGDVEGTCTMLFTERFCVRPPISLVEISEVGGEGKFDLLKVELESPLRSHLLDDFVTTCSKNILVKDGYKPTKLEFGCSLVLYMMYRFFPFFSEVFKASIYLKQKLKLSRIY